MTRDYTQTLDFHKPMAAARYVRRDRYVWPGGYETVLLTSDGGVLCADCVADNFSQISRSHRNDCRDGWKPAGFINTECLEETTICDHCGKTIWEIEP